MKTEAMKWAAVTAMSVEHLHRIVGGQDWTWALLLGRVAFPVFALLVAYNGRWRSSSVSAYAMRLLVLGVISLPLSVAAFGVWQLNVLFTLAVGLLLAEWLDRNPGWFLYAVVAGIIGWGAEVWTGARVNEFGVCGVLAVVWAWMLEDEPLVGCVGFLTAIFFANVAVLAVPWVVLGLSGIIGVSCAATLGGVEVPRLPKLFYYIFYPAHLLLFVGMRTVLGG